MASPEYDQKSSRERIWSAAVWGTLGVIAIVALANFLGPQIAALEKSIHPIS